MEDEIRRKQEENRVLKQQHRAMHREQSHPERSTESSGGARISRLGIPRMKNFQCIYAIVIRGKTSTKLILVHGSSSIYIIFLKYMLRKLFFYPGNKAPGKVNLVSPLVIIKV